MNKFFNILIALLLTTTAIYAQKIHVKGYVLDAETGEPIVGASVIIKGTRTGTVTGIDGDFSLTVNKDERLIISYLGKRTTTVTAKGDLKVRLTDDSKSINDVIVVAYGTQQRRDLTGSIARVNSSTITESPVTSI